MIDFYKNQSEEKEKVNKHEDALALLTIEELVWNLMNYLDDTHHLKDQPKDNVDKVDTKNASENTNKLLNLLKRLDALSRAQKQEALQELEKHIKVVSDHVRKNYPGQRVEKNVLKYCASIFVNRATSISDGLKKSNNNNDLYEIMLRYHHQAYLLYDELYKLENNILKTHTKFKERIINRLMYCASKLIHSAATHCEKGFTYNDIHDLLDSVFDNFKKIAQAQENYREIRKKNYFPIMQAAYHMIKYYEILRSDEKIKMYVKHAIDICKAIPKDNDFYKINSINKNFISDLIKSTEATSQKVQIGWIKLMVEDYYSRLATYTNYTPYKSSNYRSSSPTLHRAKEDKYNNKSQNYPGKRPRDNTQYNSHQSSPKRRK